MNAVIAYGRLSRSTIGTSFRITSRRTPPNTPVITPIIVAVKVGMPASSASETPTMLKKPRPIASAAMKPAFGMMRCACRMIGVATSDSAKIRIT